MDLQEIFGEDLTPQVKEKLGDDFKIFKKSEGSYLPREEYNKVATEKKNLEAQLNDLNSKIGDLDKFSSENENLKSEIEKIRSESATLQENLQKESERTTKKAKIELMVGRKAGENTDLIMAKYFNDPTTIDNIPMVNGEIVGTDELLKPIIEKHKSLFGTQQFVGEPPTTGDSVDDKSAISGLNDEDKKLAQKTNLSEDTIADFKKNNKEKYEKLREIYLRRK